MSVTTVRPLPFSELCDLICFGSDVFREPVNSVYCCCLLSHLFAVLLCIHVTMAFTVFNFLTFELCVLFGFCFILGSLLTPRPGMTAFDFLWCFSNRNIPRLQCCAHRHVPSLDVLVESSCCHRGVTLRPLTLFPPTAPNYQDYVLLCMRDKAVCASKKRPLAAAEVHSMTSCVCTPFLFLVWWENWRLTPQDPHSCTCS